jgi:radical SAM protein with 4Fe4S-binding SPASM domain
MSFLYQANVTRKCGLRCAHCYISSKVKDESGEMSVEDLLKIVSGIADHMAVNGQTNAEIHVIGGEPTVLGLPFFQKAIPEAKAILDRVSDRGRLWTYDLILVTNLLSDDILPIARMFNRVNTSWEPVTRFPKPKIEARWREAVKTLLDAGVDLGVTTSVTRPTVAMGAGRVLDSLYSVGLKQMHFGFFIPSGDGLVNYDAMMPAFHETSGFLIDVAEWHFAHRDADPGLYVNPVESMLAAIHTGACLDDVVCPIIAGSMDIDYDGRAATCLEAGGNEDAVFAGNVIETSVAAVANSAAFKRDVVKAIRQNPGCRGCPEFDVCRSGCGVLARQWDPATDLDCPGFRGFLRHLRSRHAEGLRPKYTEYNGKPGC